MSTQVEPKMGRFSVEIELANERDLGRLEDGVITPEQVRRATVRGLVDSGATRLVIPASVANQLGLKAKRSTKVRYANGQAEIKGIVSPIHLTYGNRDGVFDAIVEPNRDSALIGAIVLEALDLVVDCTNQRLTPRDPNEIISEIG